MRIKARENFSNTEKAKPYTTVVDPVMDIAIKDDEKYRKDSEEIFDPYKRVKAKPFLGAEKQPVPKEPEEPKLKLEESLFDEELLMEKQWNVNLQSGKELRQAIEDEDYEGVIEGIKSCYREMLENGIIDEDDFNNWTEQLDWIDLDDEDVEESINYELDELFDACDNLGCWVELNDVSDEDIDDYEF